MVVMPDLIRHPHLGVWIPRSSRGMTLLEKCLPKMQFHILLKLFNGGPDLFGPILVRI